MDNITYLAAFIIGLMGGAHCIGMCGGVIGALTLAINPRDHWRRWWALCCYNLGRLLSYVMIAVLFFVLADKLGNYLSFSFVRVLAGVLLIAMGLYLADWWRGLILLEKVGGVLWKRIEPLSKTLIPVRTTWQALLLGMLWGWLPCGLIYSALVYSATANSLQGAALTMLSFGLGTLPAVLLSGLFAERVLQFVRKKNIRALMAVLLIFFGLWTLYHTVAHAHHHSDHSSERSLEEQQGGHHGHHH